MEICNDAEKKFNVNNQECENCEHALECLTAGLKRLKDQIDGSQDGGRRKS